jgi:hypothetical protein
MRSAVILVGTLMVAHAEVSWGAGRDRALRTQLTNVSALSVASPTMIDCTRNRTARSCAPSPIGEHDASPEDTLAQPHEEPAVITGADRAKLRAPIRANGPANPSGFDVPLAHNLALNLELDLAKEPEYLRDIELNDVAARTGVMWRF